MNNLHANRASLLQWCLRWRWCPFFQPFLQISLNFELSYFRAAFCCLLIIIGPLNQLMFQLFSFHYLIIFINWKVVFPLMKSTTKVKLNPLTLNLSNFEQPYRSKANCSTYYYFSLTEVKVFFKNSFFENIINAS